MREWTTSELKYLREHYDKMRPIEIAAVLGRTSASVRGMAGRLSIVEKKTGQKPRFKHTRRRCPGCGKLYGGSKCPRCVK